MNWHVHKILNLKPTVIFKNCSHVFLYPCGQSSYTTQHGTFLIVFHLILPTVVMYAKNQTVLSMMMSSGGEWDSQFELYLLPGVPFSFSGVQWRSDRCKYSQCHFEKLFRDF